MKIVNVYINLKDSHEFYKFMGVGSIFNDIFIPNWDCENELPPEALGKIIYDNTEYRVFADPDINYDLVDFTKKYQPERLSEKSGKENAVLSQELRHLDILKENLLDKLSSC